jgi:CDP-4-dehydro-6-deoxyglucose reductase, E1
MINLIKDTIDKGDIEALIKWLQTNPRLTKGELTVELEKKWSKWLDAEYSIYVNSGSSANLAIIYALKLLKGKFLKKIVVPAVSWATTVSPIIQFGLKPILCEADKETLGINLEQFEKICKKEKPDALMLVHVLGTPNKMSDIIYLCEKYDVMLIEDSCESIGSTFKGIKTGNFGFASSFSFYYGHHMSTIEGGMISTNDRDFCNLVRSIRAHGWDRDVVDEDKKLEKKTKYNIDDFKALYTFYYPGFNLRSTDLQAFIGLRQLEKINMISKRRNQILKIYDKLINNDYWKLNINREDCFISNFAYPIISPKINNIVKELQKNNIETRPLICGSIGKQPFWIDLFGEQSFPFADEIHNYGLYLPNNHQITNEEIKFICDIVNKGLGE